MGKFKRIPVKDIKAMQKILDDLPDKNLGKTREEAAEMLNATIRKALEKGYTLKELAKIMAEGNVAIPAPIIRAKALPAKATAQKRKPAARPETVKSETVKPVAAHPATSPSHEPMPAYYTPDRPDTEL